MKEGHLSTNLLREGHPDFVICFIALLLTSPSSFAARIHWTISLVYPPSLSCSGGGVDESGMTSSFLLRLKVILKEP